MKRNLGLIGIIAGVSALIGGCSPVIGYKGKVYTIEEFARLNVEREPYQKREIPADEFGNRPMGRGGVDSDYVGKLVELNVNSTDSFIQGGNRAVLFYGKDNDSSFELVNFDRVAHSVDNVNFGVINSGNRELLARYDIGRVPTILLFRDGKVIDVINDGASEPYYERWSGNRAEKIKKRVQSRYSK